MPTWTRRPAALAAAPFLTGCTVPSAGATGISVTADGQPLGVIVVCHDHIDGASLYPADDDPATRDTAGRWHRSEALTGFSTWPLTSDIDGAGDGWTVEKPLGTLDPEQSYRMYGWTTDSSWASAPVGFTAADLAELKPGQVRYEIGDEVSIASIEDFRETVCDQF
ncbi:hypothetical protein ACH4M4_05830 [Streptomyces sp. NPDC017254]|uniref:hypothetical protein n=1 Tax=unclassified Streptomyces TaxID=2593676 RepID=UPI0037A5FCE6